MLCFEGTSSRCHVVNLKLPIGVFRHSQDIHEWGWLYIVFCLAGYPSRVVCRYASYAAHIYMTSCYCVRKNECLSGIDKFIVFRCPQLISIYCGIVRHAFIRSPSFFNFLFQHACYSSKHQDSALSATNGVTSSPIALAKNSFDDYDATTSSQQPVLSLLLKKLQILHNFI